MKTKEVIASVQSIIDCFEICRVHKKEVYVPIDEEDVEALKIAIAAIEKAPSVTPAEKVGRWILAQRGKYVDVNCSECGFSRIKEFAHNYTVEDISEQEFRDYVEKNKMNFCECCGAKMGVKDEIDNK